MSIKYQNNASKWLNSKGSTLISYQIKYLKPNKILLTQSNNLNRLTKSVKKEEEKYLRSLFL